MNDIDTVIKEQQEFRQTLRPADREQQWKREPGKRKPTKKRACDVHPGQWVAINPHTILQVASVTHHENLLFRFVNTEPAVEYSRGHMFDVYDFNEVIIPERAKDLGSPYRTQVLSFHEEVNLGDFVLDRRKILNHKPVVELHQGEQIVVAMSDPNVSDRTNEDYLEGIVDAYVLTVINTGYVERRGQLYVEVTFAETNDTAVYKTSGRIWKVLPDCPTPIDWKDHRVRQADQLRKGDEILMTHRGGTHVPWIVGDAHIIDSGFSVKVDFVFPPNKILIVHPNETFMLTHGRDDTADIRSTLAAADMLLGSNADEEDRQLARERAVLNTISVETSLARAKVFDELADALPDWAEEEAPIEIVRAMVKLLDETTPGWSHRVLETVRER